MPTRRIMPTRFTALILAAALVAVGCGGGDDSSGTTALPTQNATTATSSTAPPDTGSEVEVSEEPSEPDEPDQAADQGGTSGPDTTLPPAIPPYQVVHRLILDDITTLVIEVEPGAYTDVQLENLVYEIVDTYSPNQAIVVDDRQAADLAIKDDLTTEEQSYLDEHTFLRIENGVEVTFHGPYAEVGGLTVGS